ncbi:glycosyltransferase family 2 protein [Cellulomonas sp. PhB143]|uniref:glycosyltransferase family 2 protein n=1 Tax=Cellulomonas sp. PhB143 TaxID=2485186 RepID=UPI000FAF816F|nr:glycosyltransferase family 2 protein [Cellulomonas sp. PhB143]ROS76552.1 cellulose synthase/poly-beta-1,6-N-acetylglucosamine synthase-like glycosyltransferase [Cellulomonas sp. PhB143]
MRPPWWQPYYGLPTTLQVVLWALLVVAVLSMLTVVLHATAAARERRRRPRGPVPDEADFLWVLVVPALDEEVTIADSVARLRAVRATHKVVLVVDDGSTDATPQILAGLAGPDLTVLRRDLPNARNGKAAGLDDAWRYVGEHVLASGAHAGFPRDRVVVGVVDADGRLGLDAPAAVAEHLGDPAVGGVQLLVRIYNRSTYLTWAQDVEFSVFGHVFQLGRSWFGTANLGGNGQFNRLSALDSVVVTRDLPLGVDRGPWRDRLTEDQDLGVRLLQAGWQGRQTTRAAVEQQGVPRLGRLYRQRTRWAQGGWQALSLLRGVRRTPGGAVARLDAAVYLLTPLVQLALGLGLVLAVVLVVYRVPLYTRYWPVVVFFVALSFGPGLLGLLARGSGLRGVLGAVLGVLPYTLYSWLVYPVVASGMVRQAVGRTSWAKTARESIRPVPSGATPSGVTPPTRPGPAGAGDGPPGPA